MPLHTNNPVIRRFKLNTFDDSVNAARGDSQLFAWPVNRLMVAAVDLNLGTAGQLLQMAALGKFCSMLQIPCGSTRGQIGFSAPSTTGLPQKVEDQVMAEVKRAFNPEFLNRLDEVILFTSLVDEDLIKIIELLVEQINANLVAKQIKIRLEPEAAKYILDKTCGDRSYGARPLRRALQKYIEDPLSEALIQGSFTTRPAFLEVYLENNQLFYRPIGEEKQEGVLLFSS